MKRKLFEHLGNNKFKLNESTDEFETTIYNPETDEEIDVTVVFDYYPPERGERESDTGLLLSPDVDEQIEVTSVIDKNGNDIQNTLSKEQLKRIDKEVLKHIENSAEASAERDIDDIEDRNRWGD